MIDPGPEALSDFVRQAILSGDAEQLAIAEECLCKAHARLQANLDAASHADLAAYQKDCRRLAILVSSANVFYADLVSVMSVQLQGYGRASQTASAGSRFVVQG